MGLIQDAIRKLKAHKEQQSEYEKQMHIEERVQMKQLSANERELMKIQEKDRQDMIKQELERRRKMENERVWSGKEGNPVNAPNVTKGHKNLFKHENMFSGKDKSRNHNLFFR